MGCRSCAEIRRKTDVEGGQLPFAAGGVNVCSVLTALIYFGVIVQDH
jgi:hypothetical protein